MYIKIQIGACVATKIHRQRCFEYKLYYNINVRSYFMTHSWNLSYYKYEGISLIYLFKDKLNEANVT